LSANIVYNYDGGRMVRAPLVREEARDPDRSGAPQIDSTRKLTELLRDNPGVGSREFEQLATDQKIPHHRLRAFLKDGEKEGKIRVSVAGTKKEHFLCDE
jgi:hypothetical protein